ncbi:MAG: FixH family protein [Planctomycetes bacterium]|nr:FixH family protein [Planctomycetota bacterium]
MIPVDLTRPWWLLAMLALVPVALLARSTLVRLSAGRFWTSALARAFAVAALVLALAGLRHVRVSDELAVVFVLDRSRSVPPEEGRRALDWIRETARTAGPRELVGLVVFGREASVEISPGPDLELDKVHSVITPEGTDLARALRLAAAACPDGAQKRIVLVSDGNENAGDAATEALSARGRGAEVWTVPVGHEDRAEVRIERVHVAPRLSPKEPYELTAIVTSTADLEATFRVLKNRVPLPPVRRPVKKGTWPVTFGGRVLESEAGASLDFEVYLAVDEKADTWRENNVGRAHARVLGPSRVLYIEGKDGEGEALAGCLRDAGLAVEVRGPAGMPLSLAEMDAFDAILVCDVHSRQVSKAQQDALRQYVHDLGGGLVMIGGDASFGAGVWQKTPVEEALPVYCDVRQMKHLASLAVCIVIDSSGSMSARVTDGRTKLELAGEAAAEVVRVMNENDELAVATVDTEKHWVQELARIEDKAAVTHRVTALPPGGGGIYCNAGLKAGFEALRSANSSMRHLILFADSSDAEEHEGCEELIRQAGIEGITLSVVAIGRQEDKDAPWLQQIAELGGGRYYITEDAMDLPRIFSEETVAAARSVIVEEEFAAAVAKTGPILEGVDWTAAPALKGYVATVEKETAEVHLEALQGDPLLARWHYGLGRSLAFTSDAKPRWAVRWVNWPGYRALWPQSIRWTMRRGDPNAYSVATTLSGDAAHVTVDAVATNGRFKDFLKLRAWVAGPAGHSSEVPLRQTGPGRYEAEFPAGETGSWFVTIAEEEGGGWAPKASVPILIPYPAEYRTSSPNHALLRRIAELTGGRAIGLIAQSDLFRHTAQPAKIPRELWRLLLAIALAALLLDVAARRLGVPETWRKWWARKTAPLPAAATAADPLIGRLREVKAGVVLPKGIDVPAAPPSAAPQAPAAPPAASPTPEPGGDAGYLERLRQAKKRAQK